MKTLVLSNLRRQSIRAVAFLGAAVLLVVVQSSAARAASTAPEVDCTFAVNGHYRAFFRATPRFLEEQGVPATAVDTVLGNLAGIARDIPADWNVRCDGVNTDPSTQSTVGGHPSASDPYVSCQMNTNAPSRDTSYDITTSLLQTLGVPPSAWGTVIDNLGQLATHVPAAWGVSCAEIHPAASSG